MRFAEIASRKVNLFYYVIGFYHFLIIGIEYANLTGNREIKNRLRGKIDDRNFL